MRCAIVIAAGLAFLAQPLGAAPARTPPAPKDSADRFNLDLPAEDTSDMVTPAPDAEAGRFTLDTPIAELLANVQAKAVIDRDMPGLSTDKNLDTFKPLSLNRLAPLSGGRLSPGLLAKVAKDLAKID